MSEKLKPCPFCGGNASIYEVSNDEENFVGYMVSCDDCDCGTTVFNVRDIAVQSWNKRIAHEHEKEMLQIITALVEARHDELSAAGKCVRSVHSAEDFLEKYADSLRQNAD